MKTLALNEDEKKELDQKEMSEKEDPINISYKYLKKVILFL